MEVFGNAIKNFLVKQVDGSLQMVKLDKKIDPFDCIFDFIVENYPVADYPRVLEIAAGKGDFSLRLA